MNGASAEPCAKTSSRPTIIRTTMIGRSHHFLRTFMNSQSSPTIPCLAMLRSSELSFHVAAHTRRGWHPETPVPLRMHQRTPAEQPHHDTDRRDDDEEHDPHEDRRRHLRDHTSESHPRSLHRSQVRRRDQRSHREEGSKRPEDESRSLSVPPEVKQAREHQERDAHGQSKLPPLRGTQSSWNSCFQSCCSFHAGCSTLWSRNGPRTRASMCVRMKHVCASLGEHTIGSPRTLNEVFTTTGHPVSFSNSRMRS